MKKLHCNEEKIKSLTNFIKGFFNQIYQYDNNIKVMASDIRIY